MSHTVLDFYCLSGWTCLSGGDGGAHHKTHPETGAFLGFLRCEAGAGHLWRLSGQNYGGEIH